MSDKPADWAVAAATYIYCAQHSDNPQEFCGPNEGGAIIANRAELHYRPLVNALIEAEKRISSLRLVHAINRDAVLEQIDEALLAQIDEAFKRVGVRR